MGQFPSHWAAVYIGRPILPAQWNAQPQLVSEDAAGASWALMDGTPVKKTGIIQAAKGNLKLHPRDRNVVRTGKTGSQFVPHRKDEPGVLALGEGWR